MNGLFYRDNKNGRKWGYRFEYKGKVYKKIVAFDKRRAEAEKHRLLAKLKSGEAVNLIDPEKMTFENFVMKKYIWYCRQSKRSWKNYEQLCRELIKYLGKLTFDQISLEAVENLKEELFKHRGRGKGTTISKSTINRYINCLSNIFKRAKKTGYYDGKNPVRDALEPNADNVIIRHLNSQQLEKLLNVCAKINKLLFCVVLFAVNTGMRLGEIIKLEWKSIRFGKRQIEIMKAHTKTRRGRFIPMNRQIWELLYHMRKERQDNNPLVFDNGSKNVYNYVRQNFYKAVKIAGLQPFRFHDLRHSYATTSHKEGVDIYTIKDILGHTSVTTTEKYTHVVDAKKLAAVEKLDQVYPDVLTDKVAGGFFGNRADLGQIVNNPEKSGKEISEAKNKIN